MPNWCMNELTVSGEAGEIKRFAELNMGLPAKYPPQEYEKFFPTRSESTEKYFCFNALIPTPEEVLSVGFDGHAYLRELRGERPVPLDGYHWNLQNWGTKWDVYRDHITMEDMGWEEGCEKLVIGFDTAWSPPCMWFYSVVEMFPKLSFKLHYSEPGCFFAGDIYGEDGESIDDEYDAARCEKEFDWLLEEEEAEAENVQEGIVNVKA